VQEDLRLSGTVAGSLATVFLIGYFATSPIFGIWADRAGPGGRKRLMALGIAVWSAATIASGLARSAGALVAARALVGVGEASYVTITPPLIDDIAPGDRKGRWLAIFFAAIPIGSALGYLVGGAIESATHSWRSAFFVAGIPGILLAAVCLLIAEPSRVSRSTTPPSVDVASRSTTPPSADVPSHSTRRAALEAAGQLLRLPLYRATVLGYCAYTFAIGGFSFWAPTYLHVRYGIETGRGAFVFGLVTVAGGAIGTLAGGFLGDRAARECKDDQSIARAALRVCVLSAGLGAPLAATAIAAPSATGFYAAVFCCEIALFLLGGPFNVAVLRSVPPAQRASAMALSIFGSHLFGDLWSPPLIGFVKDRASIGYAILLAPIAFALAAIVWWRAPMRLTRAVAVR
jgi:MFS family permease